MIPDGSTEQSLLHARINELERRLARLEKQMTQAEPAAAEVTIDAAEPAAMDEPVGDGTDPRGGVPDELDGPDEGLEGARLVAIELLSSGYARHEVTSYLHSTFGIADAEAVITGAGVVPG